MKQLLTPQERIIVALDTSDIRKAIALVEQLRGHDCLFKIGLEFIYSLIVQLTQSPSRCEATDLAMLIRYFFSTFHRQLFWDGKLKDIPNTVAKAISNVISLNVAMTNIHCLGGVKMMKAAKEATEKTAKEIGLPHSPKILAVTILTSLGYDDLVELGVADAILDLTNQVELVKKQNLLMENFVVNLALKAQGAGLDGVIASPKEVKKIRKFVAPEFLIVTPGIRPLGAKIQDQNRIGTPGQAIADGADYLVIGRPITEAENPVEALEKIIDEIAAV